MYSSIKLYFFVTLLSLTACSVENHSTVTKIGLDRFEKKTVGGVESIGKGIKVDGHNLHVNCLEPTSGLEPRGIVYFVHGGVDFSLHRINLQRRIAEMSELRACAYDRAGNGWNDLYPGYPDILKLQTADDQKRYAKGFASCSHLADYKRIQRNYSNTLTALEAVPTALIMAGIENGSSEGIRTSTNRYYEDAANQFVGNNVKGRVVVADTSAHFIQWHQTELMVNELLYLAEITE